MTTNTNNSTPNTPPFQPFTRALTEEFLAVGYFIAGGIMFNAGHTWLGWAFIIKGGFDTLCVIGAGLIEYKRGVK